MIRFPTSAPGLPAPEFWSDDEDAPRVYDPGPAEEPCRATEARDDIMASMQRLELRLEECTARLDMFLAEPRPIGAYPAGFDLRRASEEMLLPVVLPHHRVTRDLTAEVFVEKVRGGVERRRMRHQTALVPPGTGGSDGAEWNSEMAAEPSSVERNPTKGLVELARAATYTQVRGGRTWTCPCRWPLVNPERSPFLERWDVLAVIFLFFVAVVSPVQVAIADTDTFPMLVASSAVDLFFLVDTALQFFTMRQVKTDYGCRWVADHREIAIVYLRGWFMVDVVSIFPFDYILPLLSSNDLYSSRSIKFTRSLRLLKLARLARLARITRRLESRLSITYSTFQLAKFFVQLALILHWLANLWCLTLILHDEHPQWIDILTEAEEGIPDKTRDTPWKLYFTSLYFTTYTVTSVGYGDISPKNILERLVCTIMLLVSGVTWAIFLGEVCAISEAMNHQERAWRQCMDDLTNMAKDRIISQEMRTRMRSFLLANKEVVKTAQGQARRETLLSYMSPGLRGEVCMELNRSWLLKVSFLCSFLEEVDDPGSAIGSCFRAFVVHLSQSLMSEVYSQGEPFGRPQVLYIVRVGLLSGYTRVWPKGAVLGVDFVLSDPSLVEPLIGTALTYAEVNCLGRSDFMNLVRIHSDAFPQLFPQIRKYCCWTAFQRALKRRAKEVLASGMRREMSP